MSRRPRVLHVIRPEEAGSLGGADLHVLDLAAAQNEGMSVHAEVLALDASQDFLRRAQLAGVRIHDPMRPRRGRWRRLSRMPQSLDVDFLHAHGHEADYVGILLPRIAAAWRSLPCIITCHGIITPDLRHRIMSAIDLRCMRRARGVIAVAEPSGQMLRERIPNLAVHVIKNGVATAVSPSREEVRKVRAVMGAGDDDQLIGYVGRLSHEKRPDLFLQAAEMIGVEFPRARFALVGGGPQERAVRSRVASSAVRDRVVLTGLRHDMDAVYGALDVLVVPSDNEGTSRVIIEAQLRGVPVIGSAAGGVPTLVTDEVTGILVPPGQHRTTALAIARLLSEPPLRKRLAANAQLAAQSATYIQMAKDVESIYREVGMF